MFSSLKEKFKTAAESSLSSIEDAINANPSPSEPTTSAAKQSPRRNPRGHSYSSDQEFFDHATRAEHIEQMKFQSMVIKRFESRLKDVVAAYRSVVKEKDSIEASFRALALSAKDPGEPHVGNQSSESGESKPEEGPLVLDNKSDEYCVNGEGEGGIHQLWTRNQKVRKYSIVVKLRLLKEMKMRKGWKQQKKGMTMETKRIKRKKV